MATGQQLTPTKTQQQQQSSSSPPSTSTIIDLNVGGVHYSTTLSTLIKFPNSKLAKSVLKLFDTSSDQPSDKALLISTDAATNATTVAAPEHSTKKIFIDRDGVLFRFILDFMRQKVGDHFKLPEHFAETERLACEAEYYGLTEMVGLMRRHKTNVASLQKSLSAGGSGGGGDIEGDNLAMWHQQDYGGKQQQQQQQQLSNTGGNEAATTSFGNSSNVGNNNSDVLVLPSSPVSVSSLSINQQQQQQQQPYTVEPGCITLGYRGTFAFGRDGGMADVKFRKLLRILVAGRVQLCKEVFGDTLNESRDPDRGCSDRYTSRFFLKHVFLEQAFEMLYDAGFRMIGSCGSGTNSVGDSKPGMDSEESKWLHYNEFVFMRC